MSENMVAVIVSIFLIGINLIAFVYFALIIYNNIKTKRQQIKRIKNLELNKCKGPHSWISMNIEGSQAHVCRDCYFSPKYDSFVKEIFVKEAVYKEQFDSDYKKYFDQKVQEIAAIHNLPLDQVADIGEKIIKIKQDFSLQYIKKIIDELNHDTEKK